MTRSLASTAERASTPPGVVFDCNIFLQAAIRDTGPAFSCLEAVETGLCTLYVSADTMAELDEVLRRPAVQVKFPTLTPERSAVFLSHLLEVATFVEPVPALLDFERDPKDAPYLNLALATDCSYLVSRDNDLLALTSIKHPTGRGLQASFPEVRILDPTAFLRTLRQDDPKRTANT